MRLYFNPKVQQWFVKFPQQSTRSGWSDFVQIGRDEALNHIERQFEVIFI